MFGWPGMPTTEVRRLPTGPIWRKRSAPRTSCASAGTLERMIASSETNKTVRFGIMVNGSTDYAEESVQSVDGFLSKLFSTLCAFVASFDGRPLNATGRRKG